MHLDLNRLVGGHLRQTFTIAPGNPLLSGYPVEVGGPVTLEVDLANPSHGTYVVTGEIRGAATEPCRRCLTPVEVEIADRFRAIYQHRGRDGEDSGDEDVIMIDPGADRIDIENEVRDRLFVEAEQYALCRDDCRGICPVCGANRNLSDCTCVVETSDPRWEPLESLRRSSGG